MLGALLIQSTTSWLADFQYLGANRVCRIQNQLVIPSFFRNDYHCLMWHMIFSYPVLFLIVFAACRRSRLPTAISGAVSSFCTQIYLLLPMHFLICELSSEGVLFSLSLKVDNYLIKRPKRSQKDDKMAQCLCKPTKGSKETCSEDCICG